jgi:predicted RNA methylase
MHDPGGGVDVIDVGTGSGSEVASVSAVGASDVELVGVDPVCVVAAVAASPTVA